MPPYLILGRGKTTLAAFMSFFQKHSMRPAMLNRNVNLLIEITLPEGVRNTEPEPIRKMAGIEFRRVNVLTARVNLRVSCAPEYHFVGSSTPATRSLASCIMHYRRSILGRNRHLATTYCKYDISGSSFCAPNASNYSWYFLVTDGPLLCAQKLVP